jgi:hypothetical protein
LVLATPTFDGLSISPRSVPHASAERNHSSRRGAALIVLLTAAGASAVDGTFAAIVIGVLIGLAVVGLHAIMYRLWQRFLPIPQLPSDASKRERALAVRKYAVRALIPILPLVAVGWALAFLPPEDGPSLHGLVYFSLPLLVVAVLVVSATLWGRRE